jgi:Ner family transcriptional regulator
MAHISAGWHLEDIKSEIRKRHGSLRALSIAWGYNRNAVSKALTDARYSTTLEGRIAGALGVEPHVLWPNRWAADGSPVPRDGDNSNITANSQKSCQKMEAA